jgi:hypothetical protein
MNNEDENKAKQEFLRINILEKGYDADEFLEFLETLKGERGLNIENWEKNDLIQAVQQFIQMNPAQNNIIKINDDNNKIEVDNKDDFSKINNDINNKLLDKEFLQCKLNEKNGICAEEELIIKI